jgi:hypothetical protein
MLLHPNGNLCAARSRLAGPRVRRDNFRDSFATRATKDGEPYVGPPKSQRSVRTQRRRAHYWHMHCSPLPSWPGASMQLACSSSSSCGGGKPASF